MLTPDPGEVFTCVNTGSGVSNSDLYSGIGVLNVNAQPLRKDGPPEQPPRFGGRRDERGRCAVGLFLIVPKHAHLSPQGFKGEYQLRQPLARTTAFSEDNSSSQDGTLSILSVAFASVECIM